ncbi:MAG: AMP-binding protein [Thaumarchaeota archaeon]|nr:AMP-binding protein [Nitrososphaerota archaeon]
MKASSKEPTRLWDILERAARDENRIAMIEPGEEEVASLRISYGELSSDTRRLANGIRSLGVTQGTRVGCFLYNGAEFVKLWFAVSLLGAILVPFNTALKGLLLEYQIKDSEISILFLDSRLEESLPNLKNSNVNRLVLVVKRRKDPPKNFGLGSSRLEDLLSFEEVDPSDFELNLIDDPLAMLYTSGTTGDPKGVTLSHHAYLNRTKEISDLYGAKSGDIFYNALPLFHTSGQVMTTLPAIWNSGTVVMEEWFHVSRFWKQSARFDARFSFLLMTMVNALLKRKEEFATNKLELILCGGATAQMWSDFETSFSPIKLLEGYGMTETCGVAIFNSQNEKRVGSIGKSLPSVEVSISEEGHESQSPRGEILVRPKIPGTMMLEYFKKKAETAEAWKEGWLHTGDLGYLDDDGFVYFVERKKDIIRRKGENISPGDIERVVSTHENILECGAVGIKSELGEEEIALFLVTKEKFPGIMVFLKWLDSMLPYYMMPSKLNFVESLPKTANYKIQRNRLREGKVAVLSSVDVSKTGFRPTKMSSRR